MSILEKIVSGGQTGVDRAALDAALAAGFPCGGWCPKDRGAEDGPIDQKYPLMESPSTDRQLRTEWNVRDSDATLIIARGELTGGTALTHRLVTESGKPLLVVEADAPDALQVIQQWLNQAPIRTLNIAGPRESQRAGIYDDALKLATGLIESIQQS